MFKMMIILHTLEILEICSTSIDVERQLREMRNTNKMQEREISKLKKETKLLRADMTKCMMKSCKVQSVKDGFMNQKIVDGGDEERSLEEKQLENLSISNAKVRNTRSTSNIIAFYTYLSHPIPNPSIHHTLVFDIVKQIWVEDTTNTAACFQLQLQGYMFSFGPSTLEIEGKLNTESTSTMTRSIIP
ncbi:uncharacterized protein LOC134236606 [Saccostrea cucullata]|uniref:uncharacterized protein LOC134236606 n=1 Tax=Saccostrea cuccullata TaxID=36930 RepID=UPI002ED53E55